MKALRATTWAHVRGVAPLAAAAQVFCDRHPEVQIQVFPHSAHQFGEGPIEMLAKDFDLIVFDHPLTGSAAESGSLLPLDEWLPKEILSERARNSVGLSFDSYVFENKVWGLPLDAACMVSAWRPDLCPKPPGSWQELLQLAGEGLVLQGFSRMTTTALYYMLKRWDDDEVLAMERLLELWKACGRKDLRSQGSIQTLESLASQDSSAFIPACYAYSNYARPGFAIHPLDFGPCVLAKHGAVLGGAGIGVSAISPNRETALRFAEWVTGAECQTAIYAVCGGQPAHAAAWDADLPNVLTGNLFRRLRSSMERAWARPNHPAFHHHQSQLADRLLGMLQGKQLCKRQACLRMMFGLWRSSVTPEC